MKDGQQLWDALGLRYQLGVDQVREMVADWAVLEGSISPGLFRDVRMLLEIQLREAIWWKDACMSYFQTHSKMEYPQEMEPPGRDLEYYKALRFPYAPGIRLRWN
jgi:alpha-glucuronidase